jgi:hypothetical protein
MNTDIVGITTPANKDSENILNLTFLKKGETDEYVIIKNATRVAREYWKME